MLTIGLDLQWLISVICVLDETGQEAYIKTIRGRWDILLADLHKIKDPFKICFEASYGYGFLYDHLRQMPLCKEVVVAHPGKIRTSKRKNDRMDARKLAELLFFKRVASVHVPDIEVRSWRALIRHRCDAVQERGGLKNQIRALLRTHGIVPMRGLWTTPGRAWLADLPLPTSMALVHRDMLLTRLDALSAIIARAETELNAVARRHPGVQLAMAAPGIGVRTAEAMVAQVDDPRRFSYSKAAGAYFGLIPCLDESAGKGRFGHITREGPSQIPKFLDEAAWVAVRTSPEIAARYQRLLRNDPNRKRIAIVAIAHYLARVVVSMLHSGTAWDPQRAAAA